MRQPRVFGAIEFAEQNRLVCEMISKLESFLGGRIARAELSRWAGPGNPFRYETARSVYDSLGNLEARDRDGVFMIRKVEIAEYRRALRDGQLFEGEELVRLGFGIDELAAQCNEIPIRWTVDGVGWQRGFDFCAPANGRRFRAIEAMQHDRPGVVVYKHVDHDRTEALADLCAAFAIDVTIAEWPTPGRRKQAPRVLSRSECAEQNRLVREFVAQLRGFVVGAIDRATLLQWIEGLQAPNGKKGNPFLAGNAWLAYEDLQNLDERTSDGSFVLREFDVASHLRDITEGRLPEGEEFAGIRLDIEEFAARCGKTPFRFWGHGLGWHRGFHFCAPANGRPFYANTPLEQSEPGFVVLKLVEHDWHEATIDLFEAFAIDDRDTILFPEIDVSKLPQWELVCGRERVDTFRSYAKALTVQARLREQGQHCEIRPLEP